MLALHSGELVGYAAVVSKGLNWTRHLGELRIVVSPSMRGKGTGRLFTKQAFAMAKQRGVKKMMGQMTTDQQSATAVFEREAVLKRHVMDHDGAVHDLQIMSLDVDAFQAKLLAAVTEPQGV